MSGRDPLSDLRDCDDVDLVAKPAGAKAILRILVGPTSKDIMILTMLDDPIGWMAAVGQAIRNASLALSAPGSPFTQRKALDHLLNGVAYAARQEPENATITNVDKRRTPR